MALLFAPTIQWDALASSAHMLLDAPVNGSSKSCAKSASHPFSIFPVLCPPPFTTILEGSIIKMEGTTIIRVFHMSSMLSQARESGSRTWLSTIRRQNRTSLLLALPLRMERVHQPRQSAMCMPTRTGLVGSHGRSSEGQPLVLRHKSTTRHLRRLRHLILDLFTKPSMAFLR